MSGKVHDQKIAGKIIFLSEDNLRSWGSPFSTGNLTTSLVDFLKKMEVYLILLRFFSAIPEFYYHENEIVIALEEEDLNYESHSGSDS